MKSKLLLVAALCAMAFTANAQTEKGKSLINGSIGFSTNKSESNSPGFFTTTQKSNYFSFAPSYGYFVDNNLAIGLGLAYTQIKNTLNTFDVNSNSTLNNSQVAEQQAYSISPFLRKYVDVADKFKFFAHVNLDMGFGESENKIVYNSTSNTVDNTYKFTSYNVALSPGFAFFPSKKWAIDFSFPLLNYNKVNPKDEDTNIAVSANETFTFATSSFNPRIGFNFHF